MPHARWHSSILLPTKTVAVAFHANNDCADTAKNIRRDNLASRWFAFTKGLPAFYAHYPTLRCHFHATTFIPCAAGCYLI